MYCSFSASAKAKPRSWPARPRQRPPKARPRPEFCGLRPRPRPNITAGDVIFSGCPSVYACVRACRGILWLACRRPQVWNPTQPALKFWLNPIRPTKITVTWANPVIDTYTWPLKLVAAVLTAKGRIAAATYRITLAHVGDSLYFTMGWSLTFSQNCPFHSPPKTWFPRPTRVHTPYCTSIGSVVL